MARCPHCQKEVVLRERDSTDPNAVVKDIHTIWWMSREIMYSCPHCGSVLGFSTVRPGLMGLSRI